MIFRKMTLESFGLKFGPSKEPRKTITNLKADQTGGLIQPKKQPRRQICGVVSHLRNFSRLV